MFNVGPMELVVLALVGLIVIGPEKLPGLAKDAAAMIRTLRDMATGAREQLRDELGPEFADVDLRTLNPRTAVQQMMFGDSELADLNPRTAMRKALLGDEDLKSVDPRNVLRETRDSVRGMGTGGPGKVSFSKPTTPSARPSAPSATPRPRPRPRPAARHDDIS